jgi:ferritin-like metal-binding protein YciE
MKTSESNLAKDNAAKETKRESSSQAKELRELFVDLLQDIYWAEQALTKAIPKMVKNATDNKLINALKNHLEETENQVTRLEDVFNLIGSKATPKKCKAMEGLIEEAEQIMGETEKGVIRDEGIISAGQKVEHYEIATYGTLCSYARKLNETRAASLLNDTLTEEKGADKKLTEIAESLQLEETTDNYSTVLDDSGISGNDLR